MRCIYEMVAGRYSLKNEHDDLFYPVPGTDVFLKHVIETMLTKGLLVQSGSVWLGTEQEPGRKLV